MKLVFEDKKRMSESTISKKQIRDIESKYERDLEFLKNLGINLSIDQFQPWVPSDYRQEPPTEVCFTLSSPGNFKIECGELIDIADILNNIANECDNIVY